MIVYNVEYVGSLASSSSFAILFNYFCSMLYVDPVDLAHPPIPNVILMFIYFIMYSVLGMIL